MKSTLKLVFVVLIVLVFWAAAFLTAYYMDESSEDYWQNNGLEWAYSLAPLLLGVLSVAGIVFAVRHYLQSNSTLPRTISASCIVLLMPNFLAGFMASYVLFLLKIEPYRYF